MKDKDNQEFDNLTNREALEKALDEHRPDVVEEVDTTAEDSELLEKGADPVDLPSKEIRRSKSKNEELEEAPAEFSKEGKAAWKSKDVVGIRKEFRRIHDARTQEIMRVQNEGRRAKAEAEKALKEADTWRQLGERAKPYIEARGKQGVTPDQAIMEALRLIDAFKTTDPATAKAELKSLGIDLDAPSKANGEASVPKDVLDKIEGLQEELKSIKQKEDATSFNNVAGMFQAVFDKMGVEKNRVGETVYPDLNDNSEQGIAFAKRLGSFAFNPEFQAGVKRRFPDADFEKVVREAYIAAGGRVSGEAQKVSKNNQEKLTRARRAAVSTPGRVAVHKDSSSLLGKLSNRAALVQAMRDHSDN